MPTFIIRDKHTGRVKLDLSSRLTKVLGTVVIYKGQTGSINVPGFSDGTPWWMIINGEYDWRTINPNININGNNLEWHYPNSVYAKESSTIKYGIY